MFPGGVKSTGYPLHSPVSPSLPLPCVTMCHHISTGLYHFFTHFSKIQETEFNLPNDIKTTAHGSSKMETMYKNNSKQCTKKNSSNMEMKQENKWMPEGNKADRRRRCFKCS